jgi:hypothetical protein
VTSRIRTVILGGVLAVAIAAVIGWIWWTRHEFDLPGEHWMAKAFEDARDWASDAELISIDGNYVKPDGVAELQSSGGWGWQFDFVRPRAQTMRRSPPRDPPSLANHRGREAPHMVASSTP